MKLDKRQGIALWIGIGVVAIAGLFPPVPKTDKSSGNPSYYRRYEGYRFLLSSSRRESSSEKILIGKWIGTIAVASLLTIGVVVALKDKD